MHPFKHIYSENKIHLMLLNFLLARENNLVKVYIWRSNSWLNRWERRHWALGRVELHGFEPQTEPYIFGRCYLRFTVRNHSIILSEKSPHNSITYGETQNNEKELATFLSSKLVPPKIGNILRWSNKFLIRV